VINDGEATLPLGLPIFVQEPSLQLLVGILLSVVDALQQGAHGHGDGLWQSWQHVLVFGARHGDSCPLKLRLGLKKPNVRA
jgi:hypothetical protein